MKKFVNVNDGLPGIDPLVYNLIEIIEQGVSMNVVSIMAHQDDEMRCLGTMLKCLARGDRLFFICVTDGSKGMVHAPGMSASEAAQVRANEMQSLADALGAQYMCLGEPDAFLYDTPELRIKLIEAIQATQAELIFTHYTADYLIDHTIVNQLVRHCAVQACLPAIRTLFSPLTNHPAIFQCEPFGAFDFPATHYVDITSFHKDKARLLAMHASQEEALFAATGVGIATMVSRLEERRGEMAGCRWAEAFIPMQGRGTIKPFAVLP